MDKAIQFRKVAEENGWDVRVEEPQDEEVHVWATREDRHEEIYIWWRDNSLIETPKYRLAGYEISLHNKAGATRQLSLEPDPKRAYKKTGTRAKTAEDGPLPVVRRPLPFDIESDPDGKILKALRGSTIVWMNDGIGYPEKALIPYKVPDGRGGTRLFNVDLEHTFYLAGGKDDRAYVSFMDANGMFRSVYLDRILQVL